MKIGKLTNGFTLIELLVVISVIAILMGVVLFGLGGSRQQSRDAIRRSDLETVRQALELYIADNDDLWIPDGVGCFGSSAKLSDCLASYAQGADPYLSKVPVDPIPSRTYGVRFGGSVCRPSPDPDWLLCRGYILCAYLEGASVYTGTPGCSGVSCGGVGVSCNFGLGRP